LLCFQWVGSFLKLFPKKSSKSLAVQY
jgi:hypothetical protein